MVGDKKKIYSVILDKEVKNEIDRLAKLVDRSSSSLINHILKEFVKKIERDKK